MFKFKIQISTFEALSSTTQNIRIHSRVVLESAKILTDEFGRGSEDRELIDRFKD